MNCPAYAGGQCGPSATTTSTSAPGGALPFTGSSTSSAGALAVALIIVGLLLVLAAMAWRVFRAH